MANRSKKFIFVPFCLMAQADQAQGIVKYEWKSSIKPIMQLLIDNDINIIQMPCTESTFNDSLITEPKGLSKYNTDEFNKHCQKKADQVIYEIKNIINSGYEVIAILGIEHSPSWGIDSLTLEVRTSNIIAQSLYKKYNFYEEGIRKAYYNSTIIG